MTKKTSVKEIAKKEIVEIMKTNSDFSVKQIHTRLDDAGIRTSLDTVRKSISELTEEKIIVKFEIENKNGFFFKLSPIKKKRGWKTALIKKLASQTGGTIYRATLAKMIQSDVRNTHILISCIRKSWDTKNVITWDKDTKSYNFS